MQDRFVADVGDFGKFGLLRRLCGCDGRFADARSLAVLWYRTPNGEGDGAGSRTRYLAKPEQYRDCDPRLFDTLGEILESGFRETHSIEIAELLGDAAFHSESWSFDGMNTPKMRELERQRLFHRALTVVGDKQVVYVDPDNGLPADGFRPFSKEGLKAVSWDELARLVALRRTLVVYHHANFSVKVSTQGVRKAVELIQNLRLEVRPIPMIFRRGSVRFFFVIPAPDDVDAIQERVVSLVAGDDPWSRHFEILGRASGG